MKSKIEHKLQAAVVRLLKPLVRILLRNGVPFGVFEELARWTYVDVAFQESSLPGRKLTDSRVSIITGLSRKEVSRLKKIDAPEDNEAALRFNRAARVIGGWTRDPRFLDMSGQPAKLSLQEGENSFNDLVRAYGGDVPTRAVFDELLRVGSIASTGEGTVELVDRAYVPNTGLSEKIEILGTDVGDLISTIDHNIEAGSDPKRFQRKVAYDNIPEEAAATFQVESAEKAQQLLEEFDRFLAAQDRDLNPGKKGTGRKRVGIGVYYFEEDKKKEGESS
ncbi:MAG: hypothetical protein C0623_04110 [Desulfuromonas sp.]|nr:MAG: hypothetical protein C0623_04110 [Desulfuromonas sp.]